MTTAEYLSLLEVAFPEHPVPKAEEAANPKTLHPGELIDILGRSWLVALPNFETDPMDAYLLSDTGFRYYLPILLAQPFTRPEHNGFWILPLLLNDRWEILRPMLRENPWQWQAVEVVLQEILRGYDLENAEPGEVEGSEDIGRLLSLIGRLHELHRGP